MKRNLLFLLSVIVFSFLLANIVSAKTDEGVSILKGSAVPEVITNDFENLEELEGDVTILPDNPFYGLKRAVEDINIAFTLNKKKKTEKVLKLADKRLIEIQTMSKQGKTKGIEKAQKAHENALKKVKKEIEIIKQTKDSPEEDLVAVNDLEMKIMKHENRILRLENIIEINIKKTLTPTQEEKLKEFLNSLKENTASARTDIKQEKDIIKERFEDEEHYTPEAAKQKIKDLEEKEGLNLDEKARAINAMKKADLLIEEASLKLDKAKDMMCYKECLETTSKNVCADKCLTLFSTSEVKISSNLITANVVSESSNILSANNCTIISNAPTRDKYWERLGLDTSSHSEITKYRIKWFSGSWSKWYSTGVDDVDWKTNFDGSERRVWSYFTDHYHEYMVCESSPIVVVEQEIVEPTIIVQELSENLESEQIIVEEPEIVENTSTVIEVPLNDIKISEPPTTCMAYWEGYVYNENTKKCKKMSQSGCSDPFEFHTKEECKSAHTSNEPKKIDQMTFKLTFDDTMVSNDGEEPVKSVGTPIFSDDAISGQSLANVDSNEYYQYLCEGNFNEEEGTVQAWIKFDNFGSDAVVWHTDDSKYVMYYDRGTTNGYKAMKGRAGQVRPETFYKFDQQDRPVDEPNTWKNTGWHFVAMTWKGSPQGIAKLFIDGHLKDTRTYDDGEDCYTFRVGNNYWPGMSWKDGKIDELEMYNYARKPGKIMQYYRSHNIEEPNESIVCPSIVLPSPGFCKNGKLVLKKDDGCFTGYECEKIEIPIESKPELDCAVKCTTESCKERCSLAEEEIKITDEVEKKADKELDNLKKTIKKDYEDIKKDVKNLPIDQSPLRDKILKAERALYKALKLRADAEEAFAWGDSAYAFKNAELAISFANDAIVALV